MEEYETSVRNRWYSPKCEREKKGEGKREGDRECIQTAEYEV